MLYLLEVKTKQGTSYKQTLELLISLRLGKKLLCTLKKLLYNNFHLFNKINVYKTCDHCVLGVYLFPSTPSCTEYTTAIL